MKELEDWVAYPYNWTGVHKILDKIPFTIVLIMFGLLILYLSEEYDYSEYSEEKIEPKSKIL
jgi:hypothetical protein